MVGKLESSIVGVVGFETGVFFAIAINTVQAIRIFTWFNHDA